MTLKHLRSSTANKRPQPSGMADGQLAMNTASDSPGLFLKDSSGNLIKVGPVHVGSGAPNVSPASGGASGNTVGEQWLDTSGGTFVFKIWDGTAWRSETGEFVNASGDTMTGSLTMGVNATIIFEGSIDDGFETTLTVDNPTADRTITFPDITGTIVTTGDTGSVTSAMILNDTIVNADINASAAIVDTKLATISTADKVSLSALNIDGGTDIGGALADADLFIVDDGGVGTNRKAAASRITDYTFGKVGGDIAITASGISSISAGVIIDADVNASAAIAGTKISPNFGGQTITTSGIVSVASGSAAAPSIAINGDTNTGIYSPGADQLALSTGGSPRLFVDSSGNVGIGTTAPNQDLDLRNAGSTAVFQIVSGAALTTSTSTIQLVAFSSASAVAGTARINSTAPAGGQSELSFLTSPTGNAPVERARIDSSGRLLIGTSSSADLNASVQSIGTTPYRFYGFRYGSDNGILTLGSANGTQASPSVLTSPNLNLGILQFRSHDGVAYQDGAWISAVAESQWSSGNCPTRLVFSTTAASASTPTERLRIDSSGRLLVGTTSARANFNNASTSSALQVEGANSDTAAASIVRASADSAGPVLRLGKSRSSTNALLIADDGVGNLQFQGNDGTEFVRCAEISAFVDGTPGANNMPGRLVFSTTADGASTPTERLRIDSSGRLLVGTSTARENFFNNTSGSSANFQLEGATAASRTGSIVSSNNGTPGSVFILGHQRSGSLGGNGILVANDFIGTVSFQGADGSKLVEAAKIVAEVDGTPGQTAGTFTIGQTYRILTTGTTDFTLIGAADSNPGTTFTATGAGTGTGTAINTAGDMPGRLVLSTTADGASSPTERMRITSAGLVGVGTNSPGALFDLAANNDGATGATANNTLRFTDLDTNTAADQPIGKIEWYSYDTSSPGARAVSYILSAAAGTNSGGDIRFGVSTNAGTASEAARIDNSGRLLVGTTASRPIGGSIDSQQLIESNSVASVAIVQNSNNTTSASLRFGKSRATAVGGTTIVASGDNLGFITFAGADGSDLQSPAAGISAQVDGTPGLDDMPGRLVFSTTADGANSLTERMRITSAGFVGIGTTTPTHFLSVNTTLATERTAGFNGPGEAYSTGPSASTNFSPAGTQVNIESISSITDNASLINFGVRTGTGNSTGAYFGAVAGTAVNGPAHLVFGRRTATSVWAETARIDNSGRLLVGTASAPQTFGGASLTGIQIERSAGGANRTLTLIANASSNFPAHLSFGRSRGTSNGAVTSVASDDNLGAIVWGGADGTTAFINAGQIICEVDGTPGTNDMPGRLVFSTTADGASSLTEQLRITSDRYVRLASGTGGIQFNGDTASANALDDYEEGTWTPAYQTSNSDISVTSTTVSHAVYTKIGNRVFCTCRFFSQINSVGTGTVRITGLPFTTASSQTDVACVVSLAARFTTAAPVTATLRGSATTLDLLTVYTNATSGGNVTYMPAANLRTEASSNIISLAFDYIV